MKITDTKLMAYRVLRGIFAVGFVVCIAMACNEVSSSGSEQGKAQLNVNLTDAPGDYQEVNIDVQGLRIRYSPSGDTTGDSEEKWVDLPFEPMTLNLLDFTNGADTLLASADLDPGHYSELRLILGEDNTVRVDSTTHDLKVPSGQESGYKIKFQSDLDPGEDMDVTIDFDAARSVHEAGNSGKYILKPVLKAFVTSGDEVETGSIIGAIEPCNSNARIFAIMDEDTSASARADTTGAFTLAGLNEGMYDVNIQPCSDQYADTTVTDVEVDAGEETDIGTITLHESQ